jgi:glycosyltransferase involved in cell wall biosynthesis
MDADGWKMKVSIVVTCYNYGKYIEKCLDSVRAQTFKDFEVIIVNDGSTDNSEEKILRYTTGENFRYIRQENSGQACAKNTGIRNARGELIAFLDADDLWEPIKLEQQVPFFDDPEVGVVYSRSRFIDADGNAVILNFSAPYLETHSGYVTKPLFIDNFVPFSSSIVRRKCLEEFGVFDETLRMGIDWDLWLRISTKYKFVGIDAQLLVYRVGHSGQMSKNIEVRQACSDRIMTKFLERFPGILDSRSLEMAWEYTYRNRGEYYRSKDPAMALGFFRKALSINCFSFSTYMGIAKTILSWFRDRIQALFCPVGLT